MGLSSKQVSSNGLDWNNSLLEAEKLEFLPKFHHNNQMKKQQQSEQSLETLKCPRCDSTNTKFCYYNNYNKSQPRHFCRACKRHWTKGGTLRNVPVGGVRKNKRVKKPIIPTITTTTTTTTASSTTSTSIVNGVLSSNMNNIQTSLDHKNMPSSLYQALLGQQQNLMNVRDLESKHFGIGIGNCSMTLSSTLPLHQNQKPLFPFSTSSSFYTNPSSVSPSLRPSSNNVYNYVEDATMSTVIPTPSTSGINKQTWEIPATSGGIGISNYWSWEDIDSLVLTDLKDPWDDSDIKP